MENIDQLRPTTPSHKLEQYITPVQILTRIKNQILPHVKNKGIIDLGCGTGMLGLFCKLLGAKKVLCIDIDNNLLLKGKKFAKKYHMREMNWLLIPVEFFNALKIYNSGLFSTVISNPPFGVRRKGLDRIFVEKGMSTAEVVISFHKSSQRTRKFFYNLAKLRGFSSEIIITTDLVLEKTMNFHQKDKYPVCIDIFKFQKI
ncbi:MAG: METTL5 family protein [Candidatus Hodarchaeales archaeon]